MDGKALKTLAAIAGALVLAMFGYSYGFDMAFGGIMDEAVERKDAFAGFSEGDPSKLVEMSELSEAEKAQAREVIAAQKYKQGQDDYYSGFDEESEF